MILNSIEINNFLSAGKIYLNFDTLGNITSIKGINEDTLKKGSNGSGKSTLIEAIYFALFGKTLRKSSEKTLKNTRTKGKCLVKLWVNGDTVISRSKGPNKLHVSVNGADHIGGSMAETQAMLEKHLNINKKVFLASMVFGQQNEMSFLTATPEDKRQILQSFLNASSIFKNRHTIKALKSQFQAETKVAQTLADVSYEATNSASLKIGEARDSKAEANALLTKEKKEFIEKYSLADIQQMEKDNHELDLEIRSKQVNLSNAVATLKKYKGEFEELKGLACENCGERSSYVQQRYVKLEKEIKFLQLTIPDVRKEVSKMVETLDLSAIPISSDDFQSIQSIKDFDKEIELHTKDMNSHVKQSEIHNDAVMNAQRNYSLMRFWEDAFSEHGLIKYVIRNILVFFNNRVNYYLNTMSNGNITLEFNDVLEETVINQGGEVSYGTMSGGEKKRVSLSVMLALNDLLALSGKERSNIIFFDEIADSLDDEGVQCLFDLVRAQSPDKKLFIITHNEYLTSLLVDTSEKITVVKKGGVTSLHVTN